MRGGRIAARLPAGAVLPDYAGGSLLNLMATLAVGRGARAPHPTLAALPPDRIAGARNVVLLLIDGMGHGPLTRCRRAPHLDRHRLAAITSVFPSTTAAAITTSFTGLSPAQHGLTGWFIHLPEAGGVIAPLPFVARGRPESLADAGLTPDALHPPSPLVDAMQCETRVVLPAEIVHSLYSRHGCGRARRVGYQGLDGLVAALEAQVREREARTFVYAYWPDFDANAHRFGVASPQADECLAQVDQAFARLLTRLAGTDTIVVVTADHGFVDSRPEQRLALDAYPDLAALLSLPLCGEPRVAFAHVRPGAVDTFVSLAWARLGHATEVVASSDLIAAGWFGPGAPHPRLDERVGDVALVMRPGWVLKDHVAGERPHVLIGHHGGVTPDEMLIPLVVAHV